jgi:hypothetical protein
MLNNFSLAQYRFFIDPEEKITFLPLNNREEMKRLGINSNS